MDACVEGMHKDDSDISLLLKVAEEQKDVDQMQSC